MIIMTTLEYGIRLIIYPLTDGHPSQY